MGRIITPDSDEGRELLKWEQLPSNWNGEHIAAGNPYVYREYPRMLYKAYVTGGVVRCLEPLPSPFAYPTQAEYDRACLVTEQQNRSCTTVVGSDREYQQKRSEGWRDTVKDALDHHEALQQDMARAAAEVAYAAQGMSAQARAEFKAATDATEHQVTDVPKRRGRTRGPRPKSATPVIASE